MFTNHTFNVCVKKNLALNDQRIHTIKPNQTCVLDFTISVGWLVGWLNGWLVGWFSGISTFVGYLTPNPFFM